MHADLSLRVARTADIGALDRLFQRSYARLLAADYQPSILVTVLPVIARAQPALVGSGLFYVIESAKGLIGAGGWSEQPPGNRTRQPGIGHVRHVATDPDVVRNGVGRMLMDHVVAMAKARGMASLECQSTVTAVPFYKAMGFDPMKDIVVHLPGGLTFPAVHMRRQL